MHRSDRRFPGGFRPAVPLAVLALVAALALAAGSRAQFDPPEVSADSILVVAHDLAGDTGIGPPSRFGPLPTTADYALYLRDRLEEVLAPMGGYAVLDSFYPGFDYDGPEEIRDPYTNVMGVLPGTLTAPDRGHFVLGAHFDGTSQRDSNFDENWDPFTAPAPGADDNASGVAVILEALRIASARGVRPGADVVVAFFDGEEQQLIEEDRFLLGSTYMADSVTTSGRFAPLPLHGVMNVDMVAYNPRRDSLVVLTNVTSRWLADEVLRAHETLVDPAGLDLTRLVQGLTYSDHAPFWYKGYDAVLLIEAADIEDHAPHYHRAMDTVEFGYSRNGSQAARAAELVLGLLEGWARTGDPCLAVTDEDVLFQIPTETGRVVDAATVLPGTPVEIMVGVTNRGGTAAGDWSVDVELTTADGRSLGYYETRSGPATLPAGGRHWFTFPWTPNGGDVGVVRARVTVRPAVEDTCHLVGATNTVAVMGSDSQVVRAYVYPNPTRDPQRAVLHYELSRKGSVRLSALDLTGQLLAERDYVLDNPARPDPETDVGGTDLPLDDLLRGTRLAPGLYFVRVELFRGDEGGSADVSIAKMAVLR